MPVYNGVKQWKQVAKSNTSVQINLKSLESLIKAIHRERVEVRRQYRKTESRTQAPVDKSPCGYKPWQKIS